MECLLTPVVQEHRVLLQEMCLILLMVSMMKLPLLLTMMMSVIVTPPSVTISSEQLEELESAIDPTQDDGQHGITLYIAAREFLHSCGIQ